MATLLRTVRTANEHRNRMVSTLSRHPNYCFVVSEHTHAPSRQDSSEHGAAFEADPGLQVTRTGGHELPTPSQGNRQNGAGCRREICRRAPLRSWRYAPIRRFQRSWLRRTLSGKPRVHGRAPSSAGRTGPPARIIVARRCGLSAAWRRPVRMALVRRSGGVASTRLRGERHHSKATNISRQPSKSIQMGAAIPQPALARPPRAGPMARLTL